MNAMFKRGDSWYSDFVYKGRRIVESHGPVSKSAAARLDRQLRTRVADGEYKTKTEIKAAEAANPDFSTAFANSRAGATLP